MAGRKHNRRTSIGEQFSERVVRMLESPAYRVLSLSEHRCLSRLEVELGHHGGAENGRLPCTFDHFEEYGVHRHSIAPSLRALVALGFIEITEQGRRGSADLRRPNVFRLTFRHTAKADATHEWQRFKTLEDAEAVAKAARKGPAKKQKSSGGKRTTGQCGKRTTNRRIHSAESTTTCASAETATTSISRGGGRGFRSLVPSADSTSAALARAFVRGVALGTFSGPRTFALTCNGTPARVGARVSVGSRQRRPLSALAGASA